MASFLSKLFGFSRSETTGEASRSSEQERYADCLILAAPMREGSQYRLAGSIEKDIDGETRVRTFIRADVFSTQEDAVDAAFRKARQIIDQTGPSLFSDREPSRPV